MTLSYDDAAAQVTAPGERFATGDITVEGVTYTAFTGAPSTLKELFDLTRLYDATPFLVYEDESYTFAETYARADGWTPVWVTRANLARMTTELRAIRSAARPEAAPLVVACGPMVVVDDDLERARATAGATIAWYLCSMGPLHPTFIAAQGYEAEVRQVQAANPRLTPSTGVIPAGASVLIDELAAAGPEAVVREQLSPWDDVADIVIVGVPAPGTPWEVVEATLRAGAP